MKKFLFFLISLFSLSASAQYMVYRDVPPAAQRQDQARDYKIYEWSEVVPITFRWGKVPDGSLEYSLLGKITYQDPDGRPRHSIDRGFLMLVKLDDGSIMALYNTAKIGPLSGKSINFQEPDINGRMKWKTKYEFQGKYFLQAEDLDRLKSHNIVKMRMENDEGYTEYALTPEQQEKLHSEILHWLEKMNNDLNGNKIYNDF